MAGHSKWANTKYRKERSDKVKGKLFTRSAKEIISAVKLGGSDPKSNSRLRLAIQKAKEVNMPSEGIERNIKKASNPDQADFSFFAYEFYGHGGVGLIVEGMTDNKNRTATEMRIATNKRGGTIAQPGAVAFNFDRKGVIQLALNQMDEETLFQAALDAGAEDFEATPDGCMITTDPAELYEVKEQLDGQAIKSLSAEIEMLPKNQIKCDEEAKKANLALIEWLEDLDDVSTVYHNMEL